MFEEFWNEYPNHKAKQGAVKEFKSINPDEELFETMMGALRKVKRSKQWKDVLKDLEKKEKAERRKSRER